MRTGTCRRSVIISICLLMLSFIGGDVWGIETERDQIQVYLEEVDLGLNSEEELELKREFVASGALERLRMSGKKALTEEENKIYAYLTRPVRAKDEANPEGQRPIIEVYCPGRLPLETVRGLFSSRGLKIIKKGIFYHWVEASTGIDARAEARALESEGRRLAESMCLEHKYPIKATVSTLISDQLLPADHYGLYIAKNRVGVYFYEPINVHRLKSLAERVGVIILTPQRVDFESVDSSWTTGHAAFFIQDNSTVGEVVDQLFDYPEVRYANPDGWVTFPAYIPPRDNPNDPNYSSNASQSQWYFLQDRNSNGDDSNDDDSRDFDIDAPEGWARNTGSSSTVIAIIDAGFDMDHRDLSAKWDVHRFDFANMSGDIPDHYHGTMVAGMAGAATNNEYLMSGGTWGCSIMALRIDASAPVGIRNEQTRQAIDYARLMGADVINMSLVMTQRDSLFQAAIDSAWNAGIVLTAGSGNRHNDPSDPRDYPADYEHILEVAGTADDNARYYTSTSYGSGWGQGEFGPDLCAPAQDLFVLCDESSGGTSPCNGALWADGISGTSFAAPIVAGLAALVKDQYNITGSNSASAEMIVRILKGAVDDVDGEVTDETGSSSIPHPGPDDLGAGRVNFFKALAPPRMRTVTLIQDDIAIFNEGDLNGNSVFNLNDEDIDGDSYANSEDNNDDGDEFMDGDDTDDDNDGIGDSSDDEVYPLSSNIEPGRLDVKILFNESMLLDGYGGVDPTVRLILTDGSELQFLPVASGNADWDTQWVANDRWHGRVTVTEDDIAKMYGDLQLEISGTVDMAGEALDCDLETEGAQGYVYPLHLPGFVASASRRNADGPITCSGI